MATSAVRCIYPLARQLPVLALCFACRLPAGAFLVWRVCSFCSHDQPHACQPTLISWRSAKVPAVWAGQLALLQGLSRAKSPLEEPTWPRRGVKMRISGTRHLHSALRPNSKQEGFRVKSTCATGIIQGVPIGCSHSTRRSGKAKLAKRPRWILCFPTERRCRASVLRGKQR